MRRWETKLGLVLHPEDGVELMISDLSLARALYAGVPAARLLARIRLESDQRDLDGPNSTKPNASTWDALLVRLFASAEAPLERVKRAVMRHARPASDEGPLRAEDATIAALALAVAFNVDIDGSAAEALHLDVPREIADAVALVDKRLGAADPDRRVPLFEACVRLATVARAGPWSCDRFLESARQVSTVLGIAMLRASAASLYPRVEPELSEPDRRMVLLERAELESLVATDPRELAPAIARLEREQGRTTLLDTLIADLGKLLGRGGALVFALSPPELTRALSLPSLPPSSWLPTEWTSPEATMRMADALEKGVLTIPRLRGVVIRGGDSALDAIGAEMLRVPGHPFASAAFAEVLARSGRSRDVIRLVTYFAIAPDPAAAAHALNVCDSPELPSVLSTWLEAMLPADGAQAKSSGDPETSSGARLTACISALAPYPHLHEAVKPLLTRLIESQSPPADG